ncbi:MAG: hypothetical protein KGL39_00020 [Patescibacteria group bacterium]|nr:hypothetical protein [Patescibacteria group bacterium]
MSQYNKIMSKELSEGLESLRRAKTIFLELANHTQDWTTITQIEAEFDNLIQELEDFGCFQLGVLHLNS